MTLPAASAAAPPARLASARTISTLAAQVVEREGTGRVTHVFPAAAYIESPSGDVVALTAGTTGHGPFAIVAPGSGPLDRRIHAGASASWTRRDLRLAGLTVQLDSAEPWDPSPPWELLRARYPGRTSWTDAVRRATLANAPPGSLAGLLRSPAASGLDRLAEALRSRSLLFLSTLRLRQSLPPGERPASALGEAAAALAGLGGGFTPAGDDFLMGVIYALRLSWPARAARETGRIIAAAASPRTTRVSAAYLWAAAGGAAGSVWHLLLATLTTGDEVGAREAVRRLCGLGHTSGGDALAGLLLTLDLPQPVRPA